MLSAFVHMVSRYPLTLTDGEVRKKINKRAHILDTLVLYCMDEWVGWLVDFRLCVRLWVHVEWINEEHSM